jgi:hypothetical protein
MLQDPSFRIYSDESPLLRKARTEVMIEPYAVRLALAPSLGARWLPGAEGRRFRRRTYGEKRLFRIPPEKIAPRGALTHILLGRRAAAGSAPRIIRATRVHQLSELTRSVVFVWGLAQMAEHLVRLDRSHRLAPIAVLRARLAATLATREAYCFEVSEDARANLETLRGHLRSTG